MKEIPASAGRFQEKRALLVLGVDPAVAAPTGYGVVEWARGSAHVVEYGAVKLPARAGFEERLREIHQKMADLVREYSPDAVAVESVFTAQNMRTALKLAEMRGVVLLAAAQARIPTHSYSPREVKACVAGYGAASKLQMQQMISSRLGLREYPEPPDAADALGVALCHVVMSQARERLALSIGARPASGEPRSGRQSRGISCL
jgi:crossover junction endodeoxyribonuclease RuvC